MIADERTTDINEFDPAREQQQTDASRVPSGIRSCKSCIHVKICKAFEVEAIHVQRLQELAKKSGFTLDLFAPESLGTRCSEYKAVTE